MTWVPLGAVLGVRPVQPVGDDALLVRRVAQSRRRRLERRLLLRDRGAVRPRLGDGGVVEPPPLEAVQALAARGRLVPRLVAVACAETKSSTRLEYERIRMF